MIFILNTTLFPLIIDSFKKAQLWFEMAYQCQYFVPYRDAVAEPLTGNSF